MKPTAKARPQRMTAGEVVARRRAAFVIWQKMWEIQGLQMTAPFTPTRDYADEIIDDMQATHAEIKKLRAHIERLKNHLFDAGEDPDVDDPPTTKLVFVPPADPAADTAP